MKTKHLITLKKGSWEFLGIPRIMPGKSQEFLDFPAKYSVEDVYISVEIIRKFR